MNSLSWFVQGNKVGKRVWSSRKICKSVNCKPHGIFAILCDVQAQQKCMWIKFKVHKSLPCPELENRDWFTSLSKHMTVLQVSPICKHMIVLHVFVKWKHMIYCHVSLNCKHMTEFHVFVKEKHTTYMHVSLNWIHLTCFHVFQNWKHMTYLHGLINMRERDKKINF